MPCNAIDLRPELAGLGGSSESTPGECSSWRQPSTSDAEEFQKAVRDGLQSVRSVGPVSERKLRERLELVTHLNFRQVGF